MYNNQKGMQKQENNKDRRSPEEKEIDGIIEIIKSGIANGGLSKALTCEDINLPDGYAAKLGAVFGKGKEDSSKLNTNQLRKYFEEINNAVMLSTFNEKRMTLYKILPKIAYAVGRGVCPKRFYNLMSECISKESLKNDDDIQTLVDFLTAIVAYSKLQQ